MYGFALWYFAGRCSFSTFVPVMWYHLSPNISCFLRDVYITDHSQLPLLSQPHCLRANMQQEVTDMRNNLFLLTDWSRYLSLHLGGSVILLSHARTNAHTHTQCNRCSTDLAQHRYTQQICQHNIEKTLCDLNMHCNTKHMVRSSVYSVTVAIQAGAQLGNDT